ncbi:hypothetical protein Poli38472_001090 [Pythium oligandrum]|uniref:VPS9 domain-containing protein n=1 Tax=Pythium oligandrum TaxID=41045 RepID=A0A8K1CSV1_PYTOL|nr:hypothetical protein Poli38472_001090 [Pythium oligandrum]|eukprot:TMW68934.1 hypothetical protein Poli38472_001090 [Pythium oligandrum]
MMFWTRNSASSESDSTSTTDALLASFLPRNPGSATSNGREKREKTRDARQSAGEDQDSIASRDAFENDPTTASTHGATPTYVLSDYRRSELLQAARANRMAWVDGDARGNGPVNAPSTMTVPAHCHEAVESISADMQTLVHSLDELKRRILPGLDTIENPTQDDKNNNAEFVTIVEELRSKDAELTAWKQLHLVNQGATSKRRLWTAHDKEMRFLVAFQDLITVLKKPSAAEIVYQIQLFVKKFDQWDLPSMLKQRALADRPGGHVQAFIDKLVLQMQRQERVRRLFASSSLDLLTLETRDDDEQLLHDVLEAFVMEKLCTKAMTPSIASAQEDDALHARLESLAFVEFKHLDLPTPSSDAVVQQWDELVEQLRQISGFLSPRRKMDCVLRVCQALTTLLSSINEVPGKFPSADEFLPGLIYLLLKANPHELKRNTHYILEYRRPSRLVSEPGYFFTHLVSSVAFLEQVNGDLLTITAEEFEEGLRRSKKRVTQEITEAAAHQAEQAAEAELATSTASVSQKLSVLEVRARRLASIKL